MTEHAVSVSDLGNGWYRASCGTCDFKGNRTQARQVAGFQAEQHREYAAEIAKLTGRDR